MRCLESRHASGSSSLQPLPPPPLPVPKAKSREVPMECTCCCCRLSRGWVASTAASSRYGPPCHLPSLAGALLPMAPFPRVGLWRKNAASPAEGEPFGKAGSGSGAGPKVHQPVVWKPIPTKPTAPPPPSPSSGTFREGWRASPVHRQPRQAATVYGLGGTILALPQALATHTMPLPQGCPPGPVTAFIPLVIVIVDPLPR